MYYKPVSYCFTIINVAVGVIKDFIQFNIINTFWQDVCNVFKYTIGNGDCGILIVDKSWQYQLNVHVEFRVKCTCNCCRNAVLTVRDNQYHIIEVKCVFAELNISCIVNVCTFFSKVDSEYGFCKYQRFVVVNCSTIAGCGISNECGIIHGQFIIVINGAAVLFAGCTGEC